MALAFQRLRPNYARVAKSGKAVSLQGTTASSNLAPRYRDTVGLGMWQARQIYDLSTSPRRLRVQLPLPSHKSSVFQRNLTWDTKKLLHQSFWRHSYVQSTLTRMMLVRTLLIVQYVLMSLKYNFRQNYKSCVVFYDPQATVEP